MHTISGDVCRNVLACCRVQVFVYVFGQCGSTPDNTSADLLASEATLVNLCGMRARAFFPPSTYVKPFCVSSGLLNRNEILIHSLQSSSDHGYDQLVSIILRQTDHFSPVDDQALPDLRCFATALIAVDNVTTYINRLR